MDTCWGRHGRFGFMIHDSWTRTSAIRMKPWSVISTSGRPVPPLPPPPPLPPSQMRSQTADLVLMVCVWLLASTYPVTVEHRLLQGQRAASVSTSSGPAQHVCSVCRTTPRTCRALICPSSGTSQDNSMAEDYKTEEASCRCLAGKASCCTEGQGLFPLGHSRFGNEHFCPSTAVDVGPERNILWFYCVIVRMWILVG